MARIGTRKRPAIARVQTAHRLEQLMAFCREADIQCIIGLEPGKPEDISDIERALSPPEPARAPLGPGRNDPCPCGSGLKTKKCCPELSA